MGTQQSNERAQKIIGKIRGDLQGSASGAINMINAPAQSMNPLAGFLSSPLSGITLPIIVI